MWKKTSEELPKYGQQVLLAMVDEESGHRSVTYGNRWCTDGLGERFMHFGGEKIVCQTVYAWMPVPKAPEPI